ncbi:MULTISPECIES: NUDIX domain-containing protein [unclassified Acinetobacter]|uniref:NUDIX hydrolase n=1 Tax=unclassified Acinetobacter TaxID=196816 RepID=UPI00244AC3AC|nr:MULTISPECIES: NUDIX domain-containing protein [unclassified Acinetobacter]MDH0029757.1 NUDIX domain-containing protein [Acinetobacter sp. GD04021]MDH0885479.1 NUDIX domain-containing protein [Acinetobacter sp. GD03873]MDH1081597.1 NUDIX domain-containing protein [Acinetobacter sp. GD03983]MDH2188622.1 NUDIX domain-containing protein [Acinetobacter sp. GD03645]MDH2203976.1 NUDIX domain-containing protein [Acinetobacter sp. GD03647]
MKTITVAAAVILNEQNQLLLVRKQNTQAFMQVGGKLELNEAPELTIQREILEEIGCECKIKQFIGQFETAAANEPDHVLVSYVYSVELKQVPQIAAEIAEMKWINLDDQSTVLAPLTKEVVIPWCQQNLVS